MCSFMSEELETAIREGQLDTIRRILAGGVQVGCWNLPGQTPLGLAAWIGKTKVVRLLLSLGADPDEKDYEDYTPVDYALNYNRYPTLFILLKHGTEAEQKRRCITTFYEAAEQGDVYVVKRLLDSIVSMDSNEEYVATALFCAAEGGTYYSSLKRTVGNRKIIRLMLKHGADVTLRFNGVTALYYAARPDDKQMVHILREAGAQIELTEAAMIGDTETVRDLLDRGEDPNARDSEGDIALVHAASRGYTDTVRLLLDRGADPGLCDSSANTAFWIATEESHAEIVAILLETVSDRYENCLTEMSMPQEKLTSLLLGHGVNLNSCNAHSASGKQTPLMQASENNWLQLAELLLQAGADVNFQNDSGFTALMVAAEEGHLEIVHLLLKAGAKYNVKNHLGISILEEAIGGGHSEVEELLRSVGALEGWVRLPE